MADLHLWRWGLEVLVKEINQPIQLADMLEHNTNAVRWSAGAAPLADVLGRSFAWLGQWFRASAG